MIARPPSRQSSRDRGFTLVELLVVVGVFGLITSVIAAAITTIIRNESGVVNIVTESHDLQQAVNYFHLDVESGPITVARYRDTTGALGSPGTGCSDVGSANVFRYDSLDGDRVAYRLTVANNVGRLDRYECDWTGTGYTESVLNIADRLDASGGSPVVVQVNRDSSPNNHLVKDVTLTFAQTNDDPAISATPRAETGLAAGSPLPGCGPDPLAATLGFNAFVDGNVTLTTGSVLGALALNGTLAWGTGSITVGNQGNPATGPYKNMSLFAPVVDWTTMGPTGEITTANGANKNIALGQPYATTSAGGRAVAYQDSTFTGKRVSTAGTIGPASTVPVPFLQQFAILRECSDALAGLPYGALAEYVVPLDGSKTNDVPYPGLPASQIRLQYLTDGYTQVLNMKESWLSSITSIRRDNGSSQNASRPLVVNIDDDDGDGTVIFNFDATAWENVGDAKFVLFNFPNAANVVFPQDAYGTIFAPYSAVTTRGTVQGQVVAAQWIHEGQFVDNSSNTRFNGTIQWY